MTDNHRKALIEQRDMLFQLLSHSKMYHTSGSLTLQFLATVTCWYLSTPVLPGAVRRSTGKLSHDYTHIT